MSFSCDLLLAPELVGAFTDWEGRRVDGVEKLYLGGRSSEKGLGLLTGTLSPRGSVVAGGGHRFPGLVGELALL